MMRKLYLKSLLRKRYLYPIFIHHSSPKIHIKKNVKNQKIEKSKTEERIETSGTLYKLNIREKKITDTDRLNFLLSIYGRKSEGNLEYPVTKFVIDGVEYTFSYVKIIWDENQKEYVYYVVEPYINEKEKQIIDFTKKTLEKIVDIPIDYIKDQEKLIDYIVKKSRDIWSKNNISIDKAREPMILYYIIRDTIGYERIDTLIRDPNIEDISCNGVGVPIFIFHRNPFIGEIRTNVMFNNEEELDLFVLKLALRTGRVVSVSNPLLDASLPNGARVQITYGSDISKKGSSFTIRKFPEEPFTPTDLLIYGTVDYAILAYLWTLIEEGRSILVSGGTATGKTSFLNAISLFIKPEKKIVSIEDTPELRLPHPNWLQQISRSGIGPSGYGEVTMFDLLKAALRQRPDYIIVGEVRGQEAYILFQAMATGHAGLGTIHAESMEALIDRLTTPPINLSYSLLEVLDLVVFLKRVRYKGKYVRRVDKIVEIIGYNRRKKDLETLVSFEWNPSDDSFIQRESYKLMKIIDIKNWTEEELESNMKFKIAVLEYLLNNKIRDYKRIGEIISLYYSDPEKLAKKIGFY